MIGVPAAYHHLLFQCQRERRCEPVLRFTHGLVGCGDGARSQFAVGSGGEGVGGGGVAERREGCVGWRYALRRAHESGEQELLRVAFALCRHHLQTQFFKHSSCREGFGLSCLARLVACFGCGGVALQQRQLTLHDAEAFLLEHRLAVGCRNVGTHLLSGESLPTLLHGGFGFQSAAACRIDCWEIDALAYGEGIVRRPAGGGVLRERQFCLVHIPCCSLHDAGLLGACFCRLEGEAVFCREGEALLHGELLCFCCAAEGAEGSGDDCGLYSHC